MEQNKRRMCETEKLSQGQTKPKPSTKRCAKETCLWNNNYRMVGGEGVGMVGGFGGGVVEGKGDGGWGGGVALRQDSRLLSMREEERPRFSSTNLAQLSLLARSRGSGLWLCSPLFTLTAISHRPKGCRSETVVMIVVIGILLSLARTVGLKEHQGSLR